MADWAEDWGIKAVLLDVDDTLVATSFEEGIKDYALMLGVIRGQPVDEQGFYGQWLEIHRALVPEFQNHPVKHELTARLMAQMHGLDPEAAAVQAAIEQMHRVIYERVPENIPGADELVQIIKGAGLKPIAVTQAEPEWTWLKLEHWRGELERVFPVSVNYPKAEGWPRVLASLGLRADEVAVIGDNAEADARAAWDLGVKHVVRVRNGQSSQRDHLPKGVKEVGTTAEAIPALIGS